MSRAALLISLVGVVISASSPSADTEVPHESFAAVCESASTAPEEASGTNGVSRKAVCKEDDQNVLFQGRLQVLQLKEEDAPTEHEQNGHIVAPAVKLQEAPFEKLAIALAPAEPLPPSLLETKATAPPPGPIEFAGIEKLVPYEKLAMALAPAEWQGWGAFAGPPPQSPIEKMAMAPGVFAGPPPQSPIEKMAMAPGVALERMAKNAPMRGWFLFPAMGSLFMLLMQFTDTHPDPYGMEEEEKDDTTRPPRRADRLQLFDMARFGLLVGVIWTQLMLAFGHGVFTSTLHEFVWPAWFFVAGIMGSSLAYESVARVICYSITTNCALASIGTLFAFVNYRSEAFPFSHFFGGAWVLWCLLFFRLLITPLFHISRALRVPPVLLLILIHFCSYASRLHMAPTDIVVDLHAHQIEHLLLMVKTYDATIRSAFLNAPYFAAGLLMTPTQWHSLLSSTWFKCVAAANGLVWFVLTVTPFLSYLTHWKFPERPWGVRLLIHADNLSGFFEDAACYLNRMSAVLLLLCFLFAGASLLASMAPKLSSHLGECGSRIRYTIALFAIWYMIRPCILSPPQLPFHRSHGMNDLTMGFPALFIALVLTSSGTQQLFRWIVEPYWAKCWIEGCCKYFAEHFRELRRSDESVLKNNLSDLSVSQQNLQEQHVPWLMAMQTPAP